MGEVYPQTHIVPALEVIRVIAGKTKGIIDADVVGIGKLIGYTPDFVSC